MPYHNLLFRVLLVDAASRSEFFSEKMNDKHHAQRELANKSVSHCAMHNIGGGDDNEQLPHLTFSMNPSLRELSSILALSFLREINLEWIEHLNQQSFILNTETPIAHVICQVLNLLSPYD